jgi:hypothetical protein
MLRKRLGCIWMTLLCVWILMDESVEWKRLLCMIVCMYNNVYMCDFSVQNCCIIEMGVCGTLGTE